VRNIDDIWAADLVDMQPFSEYNDGVKYLLSVIDIFSKYGWMRSLKRKTGEEVAAAFKSIFKLGRKPKKLWVDKGREFYNKDVRGILRKTTMYSTENEEKSSVVERWNRTIKENMYKYFSTNATRKYIDVINKMVEKYNNTRHSSIKMTPIQASLKKNEDAV